MHPPRQSMPSECISFPGEFSIDQGVKGRVQATEIVKAPSAGSSNSQGREPRGH